MGMTDLFPAEPTNPNFAAPQVRALLRDVWGIDGVPTELGSMQDQNFRVRSDVGAGVVVKIAGAHTSPTLLMLQNAALHCLAGQDLGFGCPEPVPALDGREIVELHGQQLRVLTWVVGVPLSERMFLGSRDLRKLGALAGQVAQALTHFEHAGLDHGNGWDVRLAGNVLAESLPYIPRDWRGFVEQALQRLAEVGPGLPSAVVHGDVTPVNTVCVGSPELQSCPVGVIDFGDIMRSWRIGDTVAAVVGALEHPGVDDPLGAALAVLAGYHGVVSLTESEIDAFWPLVLARTAVTVAISYRQWAGNAKNEYARQSVESGTRAMRRVAQVDPAVAAAAARACAGLTMVPQAMKAAAQLRAKPGVELVPGLADATRLDMSVTSDELAFGEWSDPKHLSDLIGEEIRIGRWGEVRLRSEDRPQPIAAATLHLGVDVFVPPGTCVVSPVAGRITDVSFDGVELDVATGTGLRIAGLRPGVTVDEKVGAGSVLGVVAPAPATASMPAHLHVQLLHARGLPTHGDAVHARAWLALSPDPSGVLGIAGAAPMPSDPSTQRARREDVVGRPQHLYYEQPPQIIRGWRQHLYDSAGRCHLDMINNIAAVGHSHPRVAAAAARQLRRLNTNSRFLYDSMTRYAERISALLPPELDTVFLVNSGSEAADLAVQLARRFTARRDVVVLAGAYHGWTGSVMELSTSPMDHPNWQAELPSWVHVADQPDTYRGAHGNDAEAYRASVRELCAGSRGGPAAFLSEPLLGNQGALELPRDYLRGVYADVRAAGGLCIADEVQVGMARTGATFWAFEYEDVVPDIVFTAKAAGNGHPLGVVVCRRAIADRFDREISYFSSTGGGPVSCEIGLAVLDAIRDEGLQENARVVGAYLKRELLDLAQSQPLIGAVHGRGLYQGVDLVLDRETRTPARYEAVAVSERLRSLGVVVQPTGDSFNVLKVKPPMCLDLESAEYFVTALRAVLTERAEHVPQRRAPERR